LVRERLLDVAARRIGNFRAWNPPAQSLAAGGHAANENAISPMRETTILDSGKYPEYFPKEPESCALSILSAECARRRRK